MFYRHALVFGWGAVEQQAASWAADAVVAEIEPRLWTVRAHGVALGCIGKAPWTAEEVARRAFEFVERDAREEGENDPWARVESQEAGWQGERDEGVKTIIVTRHEALVEYIFESAIAPRGTDVIPHATAEQIRGCRCIGPLPLHLAALADSIVEIPIAHRDQSTRGRELTIDEVRVLAGEPRTYRVREV